MELPYNKTTDIVLENGTYITGKNLNKSLTRLLKNDKSLDLDSGIAPHIWECKWWNDSSKEGYPKGYAVWINTEDIDTFIEYYSDTIYYYAKNNGYLKDKILPVSEGGSENYNLYKEIINGYYDSESQTILPPLFYLGNLKDKTQIKISKIDNNKLLPTDNEGWTDFLVSYDEISSIISAIVKNGFDEHIENFHFGGKDIDPNDYMSINLGNSTNLQKYESNLLPRTTNGMDFVKLYVKQPFYYPNVISSINESSYEYTRWIVKDSSLYDYMGRISDSARVLFRGMLENTHNADSSNISTVIDNLCTEVLANIRYTAIPLSGGVTIIPENIEGINNITNIDILSNYNCNFDIIPISSDVYSEISAWEDNYVKETVTKYVTMDKVKFKYFKWFRLWNSGYLEHGGLVPVEPNTETISVNFDWEYIDDSIDSENAIKAPIYNYPLAEDSFYGVHGTFEYGKNMEYNPTNTIGEYKRYNVSLTPYVNNFETNISGNTISYPSRVNDDGNYITNESNTFRNDGFEIIIDRDSPVSFYSYYVSGFKTN